MKTYNKVMEIFWLVLGVGSLGYGLYYVYQAGIQTGYMHLLIPFLPFSAFAMRRFMRKKQDDRDGNNQ